MQPLSRQLVVVCLGALSISTSSAQTVTLRVDGDDGSGTPVGEGAFWGSNAFKYLQDALAHADGLFEAEPPLAEEVHIWVASTDPSNPYLPDRDASNPTGGGPQASFHLRNNVRLYGGFAGNETALNQRDPLNNPTVLSGDLGLDDAQATSNCCSPHGGAGGCDDQDCEDLICTIWADCCISGGWNDLCMLLTRNLCPKALCNHDDNTDAVVVAEEVNSTAILSGFVITGAMTGGSNGGAIRVIDASPIIARCRIVDNTASSGGGMNISGASEPLITSCAFVRNSSAFGPAILVIPQGQTGVTTRIHNTLVVQNGGNGHGAAILGSTNAQIEIINCTIADNAVTQSSQGGVVLTGDGVLTVTNAILRDNHPNEVRDVGNSSSITISYSNVEGLSSFPSGWLGTGNIDADPLFVNPLALDYRLGDNSPCIDAGNAAAVPDDLADADDDSVLNENTPWDLSERCREVGTVDMGAFEHQGDLCAKANLDDSNNCLDIGDLGVVLSCFNQPPTGSCTVADVDCDGLIGLRDLGVVLAAYGECEVCGQQSLMGGQESLQGGHDSLMGGLDWETFIAWAQNASPEELLAWWAEHQQLQ